MHTLKSKWDVERAAVWLRQRGWMNPAPAAGPVSDAVPDAVSDAVSDAVPTLVADAVAGAVPACAPPATSAAACTDDEVDIAGWPALVAPFYD
jgi:hypothetical protein